LENAIQIAKALKINKSCQELDMSCRYYQFKRMDKIVGDPVALAFADMLLVNQSITSLNLSSNWFTPVGIHAIAVALHTNCTLLYIYLSENKVTEYKEDEHDDDEESDGDPPPSLEIQTEGADALASMLKVNTTLVKLCLYDTSISRAGIESIVLALHQNKSLQYLDLGYNDIDDAMIGTIVNMLKINKTLKNLDLTGNFISSVGVKELAGAFQNNIQLTHLNLIWNNNIQIDGATFLLCALNDWNDNLIELKYDVRFGDNNDADIQRQVDKILSENALGTRVAPKNEERRRRNIYHWLIESWVLQKSVKVHHKRKVITKII
jgi:Leucine Rich repeat